MLLEEQGEGRGTPGWERRGQGCRLGHPGARTRTNDPGPPPRKSNHTSFAVHLWYPVASLHCCANGMELPGSGGQSGTPQMGEETISGDDATSEGLQGRCPPGSGLPLSRTLRKLKGTKCNYQVLTQNKQREVLFYVNCN